MTTNTTVYAPDDATPPAATPGGAPATIVEVDTTPTEGIWRVHTSTSTYVVNLDAGTVTRTPGEPVSDQFDSVAHRRDGEAINMLTCRHMAVGQSMFLILDVRKDGIPTIRRTTPITRIEHVEPDPIRPDN